MLVPKSDSFFFFRQANQIHWRGDQDGPDEGAANMEHTDFTHTLEVAHERP